jgi:glycosyltransferase involved in cell wall biosynthesis
MPMPEQNWLTIHDIKNLLDLAGFECFRIYRELIFPKKMPFISEFFNRVIAQLPLINRLCMINILVARPLHIKRALKDTTVSVIVPCKNEHGNIEAAVKRIPKMGKSTEIIFCDDKSTDGTADKVLEMKRKYPNKNIRLEHGPGICKAENVWVGFDAAKGDILIILDADLTVMPEELPDFVNTIVEGRGEFINGTRLVYPMQEGAMKLSNIAGNKAFSIVFSFLLGQTITDTLCGTKVLWRSDWEKMKQYRGYWGINDRWGDYELLFGSAKLHLKIIEVPVHYQERMYGTTKMVRVFHNGLIMLRMCMVAFLKIKARF